MTPEKQVERLDREIEALKNKLVQKYHERAEAINAIIQAAEDDLRVIKNQYGRSALEIPKPKGTRGVPKGTPNHHGRRFTPEQVRAMRKQFKNGVKQSELARAYGVPQPTISHIVRGKTYQDVK